MARKINTEWVSASELGTYKFSPTQLEQRLRGAPVSKADLKRMQRGTREHNRLGVAYDVQLRLRRAAMIVLAVAAALLVGYLALRSGGLG
jgi:hypothetical protein